MIRWVRAHPVTTATPCVMAAMVVLAHIALAISWSRAAALIVLIALIPVVNIVLGGRARKEKP